MELLAVEFEVPLTAGVVDAAPCPPCRIVTDWEVLEAAEDVEDIVEPLKTANEGDRICIEPLRLPLGTVLVAV